MLTKCCTEDTPRSDRRFRPQPGSVSPGPPTSTRPHAAQPTAWDSTLPTTPHKQDPVRPKPHRHPNSQRTSTPREPQFPECTPIPRETRYPENSNSQRTPNSQGLQSWPVGYGSNRSPAPPCLHPQGHQPSGTRDPTLTRGPVSAAAGLPMAAPRLCPPPTALRSTRAPALTPLGRPHPHPGAPGWVAPSPPSTAWPPVSSDCAPPASSHVPRTRPSSPQAPLSSGRGGGAVRGEPSSEQLPRGPRVQRTPRHREGRPPPPSTRPSGRRARCRPSPPGLPGWRHPALRGGQTKAGQPPQAHSSPRSTPRPARASSAQ